MLGVSGFEARAQLPAVHLLKIHIFRLVPGGIGIRDVGGQHFHPACFKLQGFGVNTKESVQHVRLPRVVTIHSLICRICAKKLMWLFLLIFV